jgi:hypothetical protein
MPLVGLQRFGRPALWLRAVGNLANLSTPAGLLVAALGRSRIRRRDGGLFLAEDYRLRFPPAGAFTIGNVIITGGHWDELERRFPDLLAHEEAHTWQYLYCLGLPYYLAYSACMGWSMVRTGDRAAGNFFERRAGLVRGGYAERPNRPVGTGVRELVRAGLDRGPWLRRQR